VRRATRLLTLLFIGSALGFAAPVANAAPVVLLLHGGGWQTGTAAAMEAWRADFAAHGYRTISVEYPLRHVQRSIDYTEQIAKRERLLGEPVIAYGFSAGGTIAAALGANGAVDGAVDVVGATDLTRWNTAPGMAYMLAAAPTMAERRSSSPFWRLNGRAAPQLLQCGRYDTITEYDQCPRYVARAGSWNADTTLQMMSGGHEQSFADRDLALAWVQARWPVSTSLRRRSRPPYLQGPVHLRPAR
jgi:acetyl esterase/lipase